MGVVIQLAPVGKAPRDLLKELALPLAAEFGVEVVAGAALTDPKYAFNPDRKQYHSSAILRRLAAARKTEQLAVVGIADVDLFIPSFPFVFGEADREARAAVVSLFRLKGEGGVEPDRLLKRARVELLHEVGHLLGLSHCHDLRCAMHYASNLAEADRKEEALCGECKNELKRLAVGRS